MTCVEWGWQVSKKTVEESMVRQELVGPPDPSASAGR